MPDRIFHQRLQGKLGDLNLVLLNIRVQYQPVVMAQLIDGDEFMDVLNFLPDGYHAVRVGDAVAHQVGNGGDDSCDIVTVAGQGKPVHHIHGIENKMRVDLRLKSAQLRTFLLFVLNMDSFL